MSPLGRALFGIGTLVVSGIVWGCIALDIQSNDTSNLGIGALIALLITVVGAVLVGQPFSEGVARYRFVRQERQATEEEMRWRCERAQAQFMQMLRNTGEAWPVIDA
ncbi:MAG TPA: hypothetical protein VJY65_01405 [Chloroflexota bacterium]|nr:hypothetical protein [Chloroflexota bacterium]